MFTLRIYQMLLFLCNGTYTYWEDYSKQEQESILEELPPNSDLKAIYFGEFVPTDNERTFHLLEDLCSQCEDTERNLKFYTLNKIIVNADGALGEIVGAYCLFFFKMNTKYVLHYFQRNEKIREEYVQCISAELYHQESVKKVLKQIRKRSHLDKEEEFLFDLFIRDVKKNYMLIKNS